MHFTLTQITGFSQLLPVAWAYPSSSSNFTPFFNCWRFGSFKDYCGLTICCARLRFSPLTDWWPESSHYFSRLYFSHQAKAMSSTHNGNTPGWPLSSASLHGWRSIKSARLGDVPTNLCCARWAWPHPEDDPEIHNRTQDFAQTPVPRS